MESIRDFLSRTIGLDVDSIGGMALQRAVDARVGACGCGSVKLYSDHLHASEPEQQALIESIVVPETWFFRDNNAFTALSAWAAGELRTRAGEPLRLLSMPCSTGEEPYSMVMALYDYGISASRFRVDAADVSQFAISTALKAEYGSNSFRGDDLLFRDRYFVEYDRKYRLRQEVCSQVDFRTGNLFSRAAPFRTGCYDAIFCRNVLIYFDRAAQARAIEILHQLLRPAGILFVAPAEMPLLGGKPFSSLSWPRAFAFRKALAPSPAAPPVASPQRWTPKPPPVRERTRASRPAPERIVAKAPAADAVPVRQIAALADQGRLDEAEASALRHLQSSAPSAQAYFWLGVIDDARGKPNSAITHYRRALYLDPGHREALAHLALLLDKQGQAAAAAALRSRISRLEARHAN